jgi:hypothetical protein
MGIALFHGDFAWLLGGIVVFVGLMVFMIKVARGHIGSAILSIIVWVFVYTIHGGTGSGIMTATVAALLFDVLGIPLLKLAMKK